ncbi:Putative membrane-associated oxidoreductase [Oxalobacteraceae bacterium IMCC9480]|nr:Putative membrane-associated oxidoreductase [Oxalobacteraceae bacterium IMCC9480]
MRFEWRLDVDDAIDFRRIGRRAANTATAVECIDEHAQGLAYLGLKALGRDLFLQQHHAAAALFAQFFRYRVVERVGSRAFDRRVGKAAQAVNFGFFQEVQQVLELGVGLAREAGDKSRADRDVGTHRAPGLDALDVFFAIGRTLHALEDIGVGVLQRHVEVRQDVAFVHQRDDRVDMRIRVDVMQADPCAVILGQFAERFDQLRHVGLDRTAIPESHAEFDIDAVGAGVLRDHQQFAHAGLEQVFGFEHDFGDRARDEVAAHRRDDAKTAAVVAAFGNFQVGKMLGRQLDALRRHQIQEWRMRFWQMDVHCIHDFTERMRTGHGQHFRMDFEDDVFAVGILLCTEAAGDDDLAVFVQRFADGV